MATQNGLVKKTHLSAYSNPRRGGIIAVKLRENDRLIAAKLTSGSDDIILAKRDGKAIRFNEKEVRAMGRNSAGVKGVTLKGDDQVVEMVIVKRDSAILAVTEYGYGKRTRLSEFRNKHRGGQGVTLIPTEDRNGPVVAAREVIQSDEVMMITHNGMIIRTPVRGISLIGRAAKGVRVIRLSEGDSLVDVALLAGEKEDEEPDAAVAAADKPAAEGAAEEGAPEKAPEEAPNKGDAEGARPKKKAGAKKAKAKSVSKAGAKAKKRPAAGKKGKGGK
jgi:DNA gyrase subunit A